MTKTDAFILGFLLGAALAFWASYFIIIVKG